ncbi:MAG TPA: hypothetical protein VN345_04620 [Blastocatellia bacterium]|jgi:hypothetical protein|nr:hypothetical protein [Blastocatellia bacterium]
MSAQLGKNFIVTLLAVVLTLGGLAWLSDESRQMKVAAGTNDTAQSATSQADSARPGYVSTASDTGAQAAQDSAQAGSADANSSSYNEGYKAGYRDGQRDCAQSHTASAASGYTASGYSGRRVSYSRGVAGATYYRETRHHNHHVRNMILTIAAPAALGAGIGAIAGGGRGAGAGALIGGGGGALYYLLKHR